MVWRARCDPRCIDKAHMGVNREVSRAIRAKEGVSIILYPDIRVSCPELYREDRVQLSDLGLDLFLHDLQGGLRTEFFGLVGG